MEKEKRIVAQFFPWPKGIDVDTTAAPGSIPIPSTNVLPGSVSYKLMEVPMDTSIYMSVFLVVLVDTKENEIVRHGLVVGYSEKEAAASFGLSKTEVKSLSKGDLVITTYRVGTFQSKAD